MQDLYHQPYLRFRLLVLYDRFHRLRFQCKAVGIIVGPPMCLVLNELGYKLSMKPHETSDTFEGTFVVGFWQAVRAAWTPRQRPQKQRGITVGKSRLRNWNPLVQDSLGSVWVFRVDVRMHRPRAPSVCAFQKLYPLVMWSSGKVDDVKPQSCQSNLLGSRVSP